MEKERHSAAERIAASRARLSDRLSELARRVDAVREVTSAPRKVASNPWVWLGASAALGLFLGTRGGGKRRMLTDGRHEVEMRPPRASRSVFRELIIAAGTAYVRNYVQRRFHIAVGPQQPPYGYPPYPER